LLFSKPKRAIGLDIGTHSVKAVQISRSHGRLCVDEAGYVMVDRNQINADPVTALSEAVRESLRNMNVPQSYLVSALPGQTVVIRYPRLPDVPKDELEEAIRREASQNIPYDLSEVSLDWALLDKVEEGDQMQLKVILVAAKHEIIDSRTQIFEDAGLQCAVLGVDSLALADAADSCDFLRVGETVALVNVGLTSASIHFVKDGVSNFIRDINWGSRELIQAIAKELRCEYEEAERQMQEAAFASDTPPEEVVAEAEPEFVPEAIEEPSLDDPFGPPPDASGGGGLLDPLEDELGGGITGNTAPMPGAGGYEERSVYEILSNALNRLVSEIRRSFDFYEHQLYEAPVDRLILTGGVAHLPVMTETLTNELGVQSVEVGDPTHSALLLGDDAAIADLREHPAQFMVAIGLAARGMADL
jgi:type IV pilus assembly protein PilM